MRLLGREARSPTQALPHGAGSAHGKAGTVGDCWRLAAAGLPLPGDAAGNPPWSGRHPQTPPPQDGGAAVLAAPRHSPTEGITWDQQGPSQGTWALHTLRRAVPGPQAS